MPFRRIATIMVESLVEGTTDVINEFTSKNGIAQTISPVTIIEGKPKMDLQRKVMVFGSYALFFIVIASTDKPELFHLLLCTDRIMLGALFHDPA